MEQGELGENFIHCMAARGHLHREHAVNLKRGFAAVLLAALFWGVATAAGMGYSVICQNKGCGFKGNPSFGGGMRDAQMTGFCLTCREFVAVSWPRTPPPGKAAKPPIVGKVWCAQAGRIASLFKCPKCTQPVMEIASADDLKWCPKCGKASLQVKLTVMYD